MTHLPLAAVVPAAPRSRRVRRSHHPGYNTNCDRRDVRRNAVSRCRASRHCDDPCRIIPGSISPFKYLSPGLIQAQPALLSMGRQAFRSKYFPAIPQAPLDRKIFPAHPRTSAPGHARLRPRGEGSQTGEGHTKGTVRQVPQKRQHRGSRNSTGDGLKGKGSNQVLCRSANFAGQAVINKYGGISNVSSRC